MSFQYRTPESLVQRCDSKNPASTCRGITSGGKPCRRSLVSPKSSPNSSPVAARHSKAAAVLSNDPADLYCWQHKDQAISSVQQNVPPSSRTKIHAIQERTSMDSLVAKLGVASIQETSKPGREDKKRPYTQQNSSTDARPLLKPQTHTPRKSKSGFWASLCCMGTVDELEENSPKPETVQVAGKKPLTIPHSKSTTGLPTHKPLLPIPTNTPTDKRRTASAPPTTTTATNTTSLLPYIPGHVSPQLASTLLTELSKPISPADEAGYIYIFWLTETDNDDNNNATTTAPSNATAASLLSPSSTSKARAGKTPNDVLNAYTARRRQKNNNNNKPRTIKLKIGRANNVHRRMNEWNRQCGYTLSLVRFYPYVSSSSSPSASPSPSPTKAKGARKGHKSSPTTATTPIVRTVPHAHRVERLIHLELGEKRVMRDCKACGRQHKEWFEIEATEEGVAAVDEVVRRWVGWAEANPGV
jgi:hypothetical protein